MLRVAPFPGFGDQGKKCKDLGIAVPFRKVSVGLRIRADPGLGLKGWARGFLESVTESI